uniref:Uncharacterized protein n=1 Tax=Romanomermis culicivorax TaxID=13658 RepID=A0A915JT94_ROMCU
MFCNNLEKELKIQDKLFEQIKLLPPHLQNITLLILLGISYRQTLSKSQMLTMEKKTKKCHFIVMIQHLQQKELEDTMDHFENNISTLSATERNLGYFPLLSQSETKTTDIVNVVETRARSRKKLVSQPQIDLEASEVPEEKIIDRVDLPNQDQWPFTQQQIANTQKVDPMLD